MSRSLMLPILLFCSTVVYAQPKYINISPEEASQKAGKDNKIVMMVIASEKCEECNAVANAGILAARETIDSNCILIKQQKLPLFFSNTNSIYYIPENFFGVIWYDQYFNMLNVLSSSSSSKYPYVQGVQKAMLDFKSQASSFKQLKQNYFNEIGSYAAIKLLIDKVNKIGLEPHADIIDELTQRAPEDSANSIEFLQYVLRCAPAIGSAAQKYTEKKRDNYMMAWWRMSLKDRIQINNRIIFKSLNKAIQDKNISYAYQIASFRQSTFTDKPEEGSKEHAQVMLTYYKGVNDTVNYMRNVFSYYDRYYMNVKPEEVKREDSLALKNMFQILPNKMNGALVSKHQTDTYLNKDSTKQLIRKFTQTVQFAPKSKYYANALNEGAWNIYSFTDNVNYLNKAILLAKRALEFSEEPEIADTYARLLYKTGNKQAAILWEQRAINLIAKKGLSSNEFEKVLRSMQQGETKID
jgi:hypothetical protein